ncbi:hypothetical protein, partial [Endozoicomonas sp. SESOKO2]|uniref:hypothetical protein n=1 Tax=Endozoicomonas sp. SESOKO2 TaxID=2828743 RepID=UPI002147BF76
MSIMFGESLPALGLAGSSPPPVHFVYTNKLTEPVKTNPHSAGFMPLAQQLPPLPIWPSDGNNWNTDPQPQPAHNLVLSPVQKYLQKKKELLRKLRLKRQLSTNKNQTTLARVLSNRIMVIEADLMDLERSDPATIDPGLLQTWLADNDQELSIYREITSGKGSGRQAGSGKKGHPSRTTAASSTATTGGSGQSGQISQAAVPGQETDSEDDSGSGGDEPLKPSAEQDTGSSVATCSKCNKPLNQQELKRIANEESASAFLCDNCPPGTESKKNEPLEEVKENIEYELTNEELEKVQSLMVVFEKENITVKYSFYRLLGFVERNSFNGFFDNAIAFFGHLPESIKNTDVLTDMLKNRKEHISDFVERSQDELAYLASLNVLTSFASMNNGKGVPKHEEVKAILSWPEWKDQNDNFNTQLFLAISSMNHSRGFPKHEEVKAVLSWPEWKDKNG